MPLIDFKEIPRSNIADGDQDTFEMFARDFLELTGYRILSGPDRGADQGRDLIAEETRIGVGGKTTVRWLVSCKHTAHSGRAVGVNDELNILDRVRAHSCQGFIGFYSTVASAGLTQRLEALQREIQGFEFIIFYREQIEKALLYGGPFNQIFKRYFPISFNNYQESDFHIALALERIGLPQPVSYAMAGDERNPISVEEMQKRYPQGNRYLFDALMPYGTGFIYCNNVLGITKLIINGEWVDPPADYMAKRMERMKQELEAMRLHLAAEAKPT
jgi:hypothetical protein